MIVLRADVEAAARAVLPLSADRLARVSALLDAIFGKRPALDFDHMASIYGTLVVTVEAIERAVAIAQREPTENGDVVRIDGGVLRIERRSRD